VAEVIKKDVKKAGEPAEKKPAVKKTASAKTVSAKTAEAKVNDTSSGKTVKPAEKHENATGLRIGAVILWLLALGCEVVAILVLKEKLELPLPFEPVVKLLIFLALDLVFLVIGSQLWKKANHKDPVSKKKGEFKWWLWNNMGVIVAAIAFIPFIVLTLSDKKADPKLKKIASIAAAVMLAIGALTSYDWNPASLEQVQEAESVLEDYDVYWTSGGQRYHLDENCSALAHSSEIYKGTVNEAVDSYGKDFLCKFCMHNHEGEIEGIENLVYGAEVPAE